MEAKNLIGGLLAGAAIGVAVGILLAPRSGEQTRKKLMRESKTFNGRPKAFCGRFSGHLKGEDIIMVHR
jgi:hypothetical protein